MEIKQITSSVNHCLHLCNNLNSEEIVFSYLVDADVFVTNNVETWERRLKERGISCPVKRPELIRQGERIVVESCSLGEDWKKWEKKWEKQNQAVCIYNIDELDSSILKYLVNVHDKLILSVNKMRIVSDKHLEKEIDDVNPEIVEKLVKRELTNIVLSLLLSKPMCGTELVKILYEKFKVFISPGMLYPTLHELEKSGLLKYEYKLKNKVYTVQEKKQAEILLRKHVRANSLLSEFLVSE